MKAHELAKALLASPNVPVVINGWGSDEGFTFEVTEISPLGTCAYSGAHDTKRTPRDAMGYQKPRECLSLCHGRKTPTSDKQIREAKTAQRKAARLKKTNPQAYALQYATFEPLTPDAIAKMADTESIPGVDIDEILNQLYAVKRRRESTAECSIIEPYQERERKALESLKSTLTDWERKNSV